MGKVILIITVLIFTAHSNSQGWISQPSGTTSILRSVFFLNVNTGFAVGNSKLRTTNGGVNWLPMTAFNDSYDIQFLDSNTGFLLGYFKPVTLQKSTDGGLNWFVVNYPPVSGYPYLSMHFFNSTTGFINTSKTTNGGITWFDTYPAQTMNKVFFLNENTGWECNAAGSVIKTTNCGVNWTYYNAGSNTGLTSIFFANENTGWAVGSSSRVYKSTNGGVNWSMIYNQGLCGLNTLYFINDQTGWIAGCEGAIHKTTNGGTSWVQQSIATTTNLYDIQFINENTGWAVGAGGRILKTTTGGITGIEPVSNEIPKQFSLSQNYPNPFNPTTKIRFEISGSSVAQTFLSVYDLLGRKVATLVNEELKPGTYDVNWDASDFPNGVYFYKLTAGSFSETKKMVLIK